MPTQVPNQKLALRYGTRQRYARLPIQSGGTFAEGGDFFIQLPPVGLLSEINLRLLATVTTSDAAALKVRGPWDLISRIQVRSNVGAGTIYDTTGYGNYVVRRMMESRNDVAHATWGNASLYAAPVAKGANSWILTYRIPISLNQGENFEAGLINLQNPETQIEVRGTYNTGLAMATLVTAVTGSLQAGYGFYEVPDPQRVQLPPTVYHRIMERRQNIAAVGDQTYTVEREGILLRLAHIFQGNDAADDTVDNFRLRGNSTDYLYTKRLWEMQMDEYYRYGSLPTAVHAWDFLANMGSGQPDYGDFRDAISTEDLTLLESISDYQGSVAGTLHAMDTIREFIQFPG